MQSMPAFIGKLLDRRPSLYPHEEWDDILDIQIRKYSPELRTDLSDAGEYLKAFKAGLYLLNESLDASHVLSQELEHTTGSYWHGIMHRMEGDYSNAKYWFRIAGRHAIHEELWKQSRPILKQHDLSSLQSVRLRGLLRGLAQAEQWDPYLMTDAVQVQVGIAREAEGETVLQKLQALEIRLLLAYSYEQCCGGKLF